MRLRQRQFPVLPTLLTLGNGTCGLISIAVSTTGQTELGATTAAFYAGLLIYLGMLFDTFDGHAARLSNQTSDFGVQLDSLCDAITFGVAPVFIMLSFSDLFHVRFLWAIGVLFVLCAVLRLARFNVDGGKSDHHDFRGLPSPAAAGTVAAFGVAMPRLIRLGTDPSLPDQMQEFGRCAVELSMLCVPMLTLILACLMVSRVRYPHVFNQWFRGHRNFYHLVQLLFAVVAILTTHELALPVIFCFFAFGRPSGILWKKSSAPLVRLLPMLHRGSSDIR